MKILGKVPYYRLCGLKEFRMVEGWRFAVSCDGDVLDFNSYGVGKVRPMKQCDNGKGYMFVRLGGRYRYVHRLVAKAFLPNPNGCNEIDHIDTVRGNNRVENLRWVTHKENCNNPKSLKHYSERRRRRRSVLDIPPLF